MITMVIVVRTIPEREIFTFPIVLSIVLPPALRTNLFFCPKIPRGSPPRSDQNIFFSIFDQSGAVAVFTSAFCSKT